MEIKSVGWFDDRYYRVQTEDSIVYLPSVTTVLCASPKPFIAQWRGEVGNDEANKKFWEAGERGTRIHNATLMYDEGGCVIYQPWGHPQYSNDQIQEITEKHERKICILHDQDELWQVYKWRLWLEETRAKIVEKELVVYSLGLNCAGTLDRVVSLDPGEYMVNGSRMFVIEEQGLYVLDIKSSKSVDDDYYLQVAAYQKMYEEMTGATIAGRIIVHTNATTKRGIEGLATHVRMNDVFDEDLAAFMHIKATWERKFKGLRPKIFELPTILSKPMEEVSDVNLC